MFRLILDMRHKGGEKTTEERSACGAPNPEDLKMYYLCLSCDLMVF